MQQNRLEHELSAEGLPLTQAQLSIWLVQMLDRDDPCYNIAECVEIPGPVDGHCFEEALREVFAKNDAWHIRIAETENGPRQYLYFDPNWPFDVHDFSCNASPRDSARAWMEKDRSKALKLGQNPLYRFALLKISPDLYYWYAVAHHLIIDGFGWLLFLERVAAAYTAKLEHKPVEIGDCGSWRELLDEESSYRGSERFQRDRSFWSSKLSNLPQRVTLSGKPPRLPSAFMKTTGWLPRSVDLEALARQHASSVTAVLIAATAIYLHRMTGANDLMIGFPVHARVGRKMRSIVGMVVNAVTVRVSVDAKDRVADVIALTTRELRDAMRHQRYRYEDIRRDLRIGLRDGELAGIVVNYTPRDQDIKFGDLSALENPLGNWWVEDLQIVYYGGQDPRGLRIDAICNPDNYDREDLELHLRRFTNLLAGIAASPGETTVARVPISSHEKDGLALPSDVQWRQILRDWNATRADYPFDRCIHELFEQQAAKTPEAVAVIFEDLEVSYAGLNERANRLAHWLLAEGVQPDDRVAIAVERSIEMIVALLGTLKAGGAYVPLDPAYPVERLLFMLQDSAPRILLTQVAVLPRLGKIPADISVLALDGAEGTWRECSSLNPDPRAIGLTSSNLAYVIYTSGSTGSPKGVMVEHKSLQSSTNARFRVYDDYKGLLLLSSMSFDSSVAGIFGTLIGGGSLFLATLEAAADPRSIGSRLSDAQISTIVAVPSLLNTLMDECQFKADASLTQIITGGEVFAADFVEKIRSWAPQAALFNEYGPTEATVWATVYRCLPDRSRRSVPIGKPIANTRIYILDGAGEPVPVGVAGEIHIGGAGVARGYLNRPELTSERFLHDPFAAEEGEANARMYRTGDLGRWLPDGNIEFLGRNDHQVKIRGFRIELGEIEAVLRTLAGVRDAAVVALEDGPAAKRLVAFIVGDTSGSPAENSALRASLAKQLPDVFIPSAFVVLPKMPRLPNGKLDRHALAQSDVAPADRRLDAAPLRTPTEFVLAEIWSDILRRPVVNREDDYFELGGDSLRATVLVTRIRRIFGVDLPLRAVFDTRGLHALASRIDAAARDGRQETMPAIERAPEGRPAPLSFSQHRMWLIQSLDPQNTAYNMSGAIRLNGDIDVAALSGAIDEVCRRHEILRTTYDMVDGDIVQLTHELQSDPMNFTDLTVQYSDPEAEMMRRVNVEARRPIDLTRGPVFSCALMRLGPNEHVLQITVHHIAGDQWSFGLIGREMSALYNAARAGGQSELPSAPIRYRDFAIWQQAFLQSAALRIQLDYWTDRLRDVPPLELPTDHRRPPVQTLNGSYCQRRIPDALLEALEKLGHRESTTLFMTMFAAFAALLQRLAGQTDIPIGVPIANRTHGAVEMVVGTFVNTLVLRVDLSGDPTFSELLSRVRRLALDAFANQDVPFDKLVQKIAVARDPSRGPLTQVLFNMLNAPMYGIDLEGVAWEPILTDRGGAQFELSLSIDRQITQTVTVEYNTDLFDRSSIERFIGRYLRLMERSAEAPEKRLSQLEVLPDDERLQVLHTWNTTSTRPPAHPFIATFATVAAARRDTPAVSFEGRTLSYGELDARANALADDLSRRGVKRGAFVGIYLTRSLDMIVALLAVQKAGCAYVPLDPGLPLQRLKFMISDSGVRLILSSSDTAGKLDLTESVEVIDVGGIAEKGELNSTSDPGRGPTNSDPAYMIYTSGSTGVPKGVVISHGALANFLVSMLKEPGLTDTDVLAAETTISFDIAGLELYLPLLAGARIELVPSSTAGDGRALAELLRQSGATVMQATPATWQMLLDAGWRGGTSFRALCGGEALSRDLADRLLEGVGELWNLYGPTETTIWSTVAAVDRGEAPISIGRPIANTRIYIVNGDTPAPIGVAGEICIGGDGVAIGYHARPGLTKERFRPDPFTGRAADRIYRTGDLGRWGADGRLYHLGRMDDQVKVRGYRIELGEIEAVVHAHLAIRQAAVAAHRAGPADTRLVAYVVYREGEEMTATELRRYVRDQLPEYMVPSIVVVLDRLPLTPNGKLDRNALANPFLGSVRTEGAVEPPASGTEAMVADIWRKLLKIDAVGADDNFFDLGGHSLLALRVVTEIESRTRARVDPRSLFFQTLRQFSTAVSNAAGGER